jgi:pyruvate/2-oxoglutarate dehydrogenase complex dihydrolipoamide dehydrogenase (E3) component
VIHGRDDSGQLPWLEERGIGLFRGSGRLDGERRVRVGDEVLVARRAVVLATGSGAAMPPLEGLDTVRAWNNRDATNSDRVPESLAVLGGGPVGSELSQAWASLGARVTLIEGEDRLLSREEAFAGEEVAKALREKHRVDVRTGTLAENVSRDGDVVTIELEGGGQVAATEILVAVGRKPRSEEIGLESVGISPGEHGFVDTDDRLQVGGHDWLYAVGDVNGRALFTHMGKYQAWVAAENALGRDVVAGAEAIGSPRVTFTDPQVAAAGKTLEQAQEAGIDATAVDAPTDGTAGASFYGRETGGTSRIVVDQARQTIVGATFTGFETADFLQAATVAIVGEVPLSKLRHAVAAYPSRSEIWLKLLEAAGL